MNTNAIEAAPTNGATPVRELFALTDEQILEIEPDAQDVEVTDTRQEARPASAAPLDGQDTAVIPSEARNPSSSSTAPGPEAPFAAPEHVRALAELYPGGLSQAKTAAERARTLDEIDAAYFGSAYSTPEQVSASRAQLAQRMMRENPAAFREMVFAGLRALEAASTGNPSPDAVAQAFRPEGFSLASDNRADDRKTLTPEGVSYTNSGTPATSPTPADAQAAAYATFERAANDELERSVGPSIDRTIAQALPNLSKEEGANSAGTRNGSVSLRERLASSVRQDVEAALKGDRQLGEQIAQILAAKRFDDATRAQVVRLINDRAQQLVPSAARRVIGEWTSATLAAHGAKSERTAAASSRREVAPTASGPTGATSQDRRGIPTTAGKPASANSARNDKAGRTVDYRKLSDEQILDL